MIPIYLMTPLQPMLLGPELPELCTASVCPSPARQLTRVPSCDKDTRDKDTAVPAPRAALQPAPLAPGWGGLIQSFPSQEGGMSFPAAPSPLQRAHMFWDRRVGRILLWDHTSPPAAHGAGDREMWVPTISPLHVSVVG